MSTRNLVLGRLLLLSGFAPLPQTPRFTRGDREKSPSLMTLWQPANLIVLGAANHLA